VVRGLRGWEQAVGGGVVEGATGSQRVTAACCCLPATHSAAPPCLLRAAQELRGLAAAPIASAGSAESGAVQSALPLWAFAAAGNRSSAQILLFNCTLVIPASDYAALLSAALRGGRWKEGAVKTAPLLSRVVAFEPSVKEQGQLTPASTQLDLEAYSGWGVNGTQVRLVPEQPLPPCTPLPDWDQLAPGCEQEAGASGGSSGDRALVLGLALGLGLAGGLLLVGAVLAVCYLRRRTQQPRQPAIELDASQLQHKDLTADSGDDSGKTSTDGSGLSGLSQVACGCG
jgi:hypothetical protein